jgi:hypothetical protein
MLNKARQILFNISQSSLDNCENMIYDYDRIKELVQYSKKELKDLELIEKACRSIINKRVHRFRKEMRIISNPNIIHKNNLEYINQNPLDDDIQEVSPNIRLRTISITSTDFIPNTPLYYITSTGEIGFKLLGCIFKGNIRNILTNDSKSQKHKKCKKQHPANFDHVNDCLYAHPDLGEDLYFVNSSWIYTKHQMNEKNKHMRHIGNKNTLLTDIFRLSTNEYQTRKQQLIHDILVQLCIVKMRPELI